MDLLPQKVHYTIYASVRLGLKENTRQYQHVDDT